MTDNIFNLPIIRVKKDTVEMTWKDFEEVLNLFNEQEAIPKKESTNLERL